MKYSADKSTLPQAQRSPAVSGVQAISFLFWLAVLAGPAISRPLRAADTSGWREDSRSGLINKTVLLHAAAADGRGSPASPAEVIFPGGYRYCHYHLDYRGWIGRGIATVVSAAPDRMVFGISVRGGDGPLDQGSGAIAVTVVGIPGDLERGSCEALPVVGEEVSVAVTAWAMDETDGRELPWALAYPDPALGDDPAGPGPAGGGWHGGYHWEGNRLCLEIHALTLSGARDHRMSVGYHVTLKGARFSDAESEKTLKLYSYRGPPGEAEITQCFPVRR
jgi:hypothetical protein